MWLCWFGTILLLLLPPPKVIILIIITDPLLVLHHAPLIEPAPEPCPLLDLGELGGVAHVAGGPPGPVDVATLATLPVIRCKQTFRLLCRLTANLCSLLLGLLYLLLFAASIAIESPGKVDIATPTNNDNEDITIL